MSYIKLDVTFYLTLLYLLIRFLVQTLYFKDRSSIQKILQFFQKNPLIAKQISNSLRAEARKAVIQQTKGLAKPEISQIPKHGLSEAEILKLLEARDAQNFDHSKGKIFALQYEHSHELSAFGLQCHNLFINRNALSPFVNNGLRLMEIETVKMITNLFHGDKHCVGCLTSGGSESLIMAVKTYCSRGSALGIAKPEIIICTTAHPATYKGCEYFQVKIVEIPFGLDDYKMKVDSIEKEINSNTVAIFVSAPQYPHGVIDPIEEIGEIALRNNIPIHVDASIGGLVLPFMEKLGYKHTKFDFRVKGVTSIHVDTHKYGFANKGSSVLIFRHSDLRLHSFYSKCNWPGGIYISSTFQGTRGGGPIASAFATLLWLGEQGFLDVVRQIIKIRDYIIAGINKIKELEMVVKPESSIIAFTTTKASLMNIFSLADIMTENNGWRLECQQNPNCIHMSIMPQHDQSKQKLLDDLQSAIDVYKANPKKFEKSDTAAMYGMVSKVPDHLIVDDFFKHFSGFTYQFDLD